MRHRSVLSLALLTVVPALPACDVVDRARDRFGTTDTLSVEASGSGLMLGLQAPPTLAEGEEGLLRLAVTNRTDTTVSHLRLELIVPGWAVPTPPRPGDPEVTMAAQANGDTRFSYSMEETPIAPGQTQAIEQRIRVPTGGAALESDQPWTRNVRGRLLRADGEALAEVEGEIVVEGVAADTTATGGGAVNGRERIGPIRLGMSTAALRQAVSSARDTTWRQEGTARRGIWVPLASEGRALAVLDGDSVARIEVRDPVFRTRERLGVGSRLEELRSTHGSACAEAVDGMVVVRFAGAPGVTFALDAQAPANPARLRDHPDQLPGTARVTRWWLSRGPENCPR